VSMTLSGCRWEWVWSPRLVPVLEHTYAVVLEHDIAEAGIGDGGVLAYGGDPIPQACRKR
jgi:hypothetical protein